jgi:hypothetical protein
VKERQNLEVKCMYLRKGKLKNWQLNKRDFYGLYHKNKPPINIDKVKKLNVANPVCQIGDYERNWIQHSVKIKHRSRYWNINHKGELILRAWVKHRERLFLDGLRIGSKDGFRIIHDDDNSDDSCSRRGAYDKSAENLIGKIERIRPHVT